jgi:iron-sulfur cluster repair protein YtfE (RIC family)
LASTRLRLQHARSAAHRLQDFLFDSLQNMLAAAIAAGGAERGPLVHELVCKVDEVHVTLQKHLRKEEEQLFPLLLSNFSFREQAELVVRQAPMNHEPSSNHFPYHCTVDLRVPDSVLAACSIKQGRTCASHSCNFTARMHISLCRDVAVACHEALFEGVHVHKRPSA